MDKQLAHDPAQQLNEDTDAVVLLANLSKYAENARGAFAVNTQRARRADWIQFSDWCVQAQLVALPGHAETVARFIDAIGHSKKPATVRRYVSTIATAHKAAEISDPCASSAVKHCGGQLKIISAIEELATIGRILKHLGLPARAPPRAPAQYPAFFESA